MGLQFPLVSRGRNGIIMQPLRPFSGHPVLCRFAWGGMIMDRNWHIPLSSRWASYLVAVLSLWDVHVVEN